ncbi:2-C-methyl-D-erythritol 2,4-cyclodiphosphate synthase [Alicyclobacillus fastidiosus]|uniref:2-C-methyl-D-erythritol 2,4-cyclodiphosphate synthase n=1 Tax=Alicyclobacillus fastidiosus TaxID=392011 RepID=A0ABV5AIW8_9BACL|nr:2-C-methyl-D-erythritol 2,4-cyclodiphosphate synthase [Alicyclobacillus fastidiosus]WEH11954.1 2-C-methyl-D-erythritol 2,4-cyclodiphosphate synthase [Alicyclobacillus fastidiosus]
MRIGYGFDVHEIVADRPLVLGGQRIPAEFGLLGHSDADVVLHAVMDAMLGALALGDIGQHFPNTDVRFKDADSLELLRHVSQLVHDRGYQLGNLDVMVLAEAPKLAPYSLRMRESIATACACEVDQVSIKATTMETLGFVGRKEGIAAQAVVLLVSEGE